MQRRHAFGSDGLARYPLFTAELLEVLRRTIPRPDQARVATCPAVSAAKPVPQRTPRPSPVILPTVGDHLRTFDAGERACGGGVGRDPRAGWAAAPAGTLTEVVVRDPSTRSDVPALARLLGHLLEREQDADGVLRLLVRTKRG